MKISIDRYISTDRIYFYCVFTTHITSICEKKKVNVELHHFTEAAKVLCKKGAFKIFAIFTEKHLCWSLFVGLQVFNFINKGKQHLFFFSWKYCKTLKNTILRNICTQLLLILWTRTEISQTKNYKSVEMYIWVFNFINWQDCKQKFKEIACKSKQMPGRKLSHLTGIKHSFHM